MIAFIPEGLPVCVTLSLLMIAKRMAKSRVLVKNLAVIETLSCVNVIASDKTGTLTQNKMHVGKATIGIDEFNIDHLDQDLSNSNPFKQLIVSASLCNNSHYDEDDPNPNLELRKANGDATDIALLRFTHKFPEYRSFSDDYSEIWEIPFNSKNKWMSKVIKPNNLEAHVSIFGDKYDSTTNLMLVKGAPDILLRKCNKVMQKDGTESELNAEIINKVIKIQNDWSLLGQRVIVLCKRDCKEKDLLSLTIEPTCDKENFINDCRDFCLVGMIGIIDPPREGIKDVVSKLRLAGIRVSMVTGDFATTAAAIATQVGIFTNSSYDTVQILHEKSKLQPEPKKSKQGGQLIHSSLLLNGYELSSLNTEMWRLISRYEEVVFARTTPEQKLLIVKEFQKDGYIVGVTGDGVNDAPALKSADIGIAMGGGSEVAMEAGQLVLLDNNFSSILLAVENGRLVFYNLRKVILYLLPGGCIAELIPILMLIFFGVPQDLSSFQMLIISLFTDIAPSLSLMMEKPEVDLLKQPPRSKNDHLVDWKFLIHAYIFLGMQISFFSQCIFFTYMYVYHGFRVNELFFDFGLWQNDYKGFSKEQLDEFLYTGQTVTFVSLVLMNIFGNLISTRTHVKSFFQSLPFCKQSRNLWIFAAQATSICIMLTTVYTPFFNFLFLTRPIPYDFFLIPIVCCMIIFFNDEVRKFLVRKKFLFFHKVAW